MTDSGDLTLPSLQRLQSAEQMELLDVVDSLRALGLSEIVDLPQLIVCGDQSSGKSSVLEAISGIPFPRQDNLCTRFATEVILRRATKDEISVTIMPGDDRTPIERETLSQFRHDLKTKEDFRGLFELAREAMGLTSTGKSFSNDILRVTFCGPSQPQLTLVDLPGLIHSETKSQTAADVKLVHNLVSGYLKNPRSIILAVVSAKNDIGNQIILRRAREVDPEGLRTLGIITKPDLLVKGSKSEEAFITLARNEDVKFTLGWHVVKNLDASLQNTDESRDDQETRFFQESTFNSLPAHLLGISFLRARLSKVLFSQIRTELPRLVDDIEKQISIAKIAKEKLGPSRENIEQQKEFLISLSQTFQSICQDAARGDYDHEFFQVDSHSDRRLCANIMNLHFAFAKNLRENGATWLVDGGDIYDIRYRAREEAIQEACSLLKRSRGRELPGLPNPLLVGELFRLYSRQWGLLARIHIKEVWEATNRFFEHLLQYLTDVDVHENIYRLWLYPIMEEKLNAAYGKLDELLEVHKDHPMTTNSHFIKNKKSFLQENNKEKLEAMLKKAELKSDKSVGIEEITDLLSTMKENEDLDMDMVAAEEAFDNMNVYYEVALNLFADNVPTLAIQAPIIREVPKIFCPSAVFSMHTDIVKRIAGETDEKILERDNIVRRLTILENSALVCKQYAKRPQASKYLLGTTFKNVNETVAALRSKDMKLPELTIHSGQRPGINGKNDDSKPLPPKSFPDSLPKTGVIPNNFVRLSSNTSTKPTSSLFGSTSNAPSPFADNRENGSIAPTSSIFGSKPPNTVQPVVGVSLFGKLATKSTASSETQHGSSLFGGLAAKPTASETQHGSSFFGNLATKPTASETQHGSSFFGGLATKPTASETQVTKTSGGLFGPPSASSPTPGSGSHFGARTTNPSMANSSPSGGWLSQSPSKTEKSPKFSTSATNQLELRPTFGVIFKPFIEREPNSSTGQMNSFEHICFMPEFRSFSCEELRLFQGGGYVGGMLS